MRRVQKQQEKNKKQGKFKLVICDELILSEKESNPKLEELIVRTSNIQEQVTGTLEAHSNGFRYTSNQNEHIDILYNNIKHALLQPCDKEIIIRLHFQLKKPIFWRGQNCNDIQFYIDDSKKIDLARDLWDHWADVCTQQERETKSRLNDMFKSFCDIMTKFSYNNIRIDSSMPSIDFYGIPYRSVTTLQASESCLFSLTSWPPFIVTVSEIEFVPLECMNDKEYFNMIFIFKNYKKRPQMIKNIPISSLENIRRWLTSSNIWFTERSFATNWPHILKVVCHDPFEFFRKGGWSRLQDKTPQEMIDLVLPESDESDDEEEVEDGLEDLPSDEEDSDDGFEPI